MFYLAIGIGIYSYLIFFIGLAGGINKNVIVITTLMYALLFLLVFKKKVISFAQRSKYFITNTIWVVDLSLIKHTILFFAFVCILLLLIGVNIVGVFGPEYSFDALWYHLTLPKLYILRHSVFFVPGGLLYYSAMPKLTEMLYTVALLFSNETAAKSIHFAFSIATLLTLYKVSRMYFERTISLILVVVFSSNLVFAWESTTAYVDIARTFYELLTLYAFLLWWKYNKRSWLYLSAIMLGFAVSVKLIAVGSLLIFLLLIMRKFWVAKRYGLSEFIILFFFVVVVLSIPLPWFLFSYSSTGNPVYPIFSGYPLSYQTTIFSPITLIRDVSTLFLNADDPVSPIYLIAFPLVIANFGKFRSELKVIVYYCLLATLVWYVTPRTGGGRFILPYLPAFGLVIGELLFLYRKNTYIKSIITGSIISIAVITIFYRGYANARYVPVIAGHESKDAFLSEHLNYSFGDFYDTDAYFKNNIKKDETVLLYGFHNLYYVDFPYIHSSWIKKGDTFTHIATQHTALPSRFTHWNKVYENITTGVTLYTLEGRRVQY